MVVHDCPPTSSSVASRIASKSKGGVHPRFGTRNFTLPRQNGQYIEFVCPLDHPATEQTPWGKAVSKKAQEGGGWLAWVFATKDISKVEERFGRIAIEGHRTRRKQSKLGYEADYLHYQEHRYSYLYSKLC